MKSRWLVLLIALVLGLNAGCSRKAPAHRVTLTWEPPTATRGTSILGYNVYRSATSGKEYARIASRVPFPWYDDTTVSAGRTYFYVVTTLDPAGNESKFSSEAQATIP
jgi:fibronectin type 3 domain-containing protein